MPVRLVSGDPLLTKAHTLAFGHNALGRTETGAFESTLMQRYPAPFSAYLRQCHQGRIKTGMPWLWTESLPRLAFLVVRESAVGATRLRYVQSAVMMLARDYALYGISSLAIAPLGSALEWPEAMQLVEAGFRSSPLPVMLYEAYREGEQAEESFL